MKRLFNWLPLAPFTLSEHRYRQIMIPTLIALWVVNLLAVLYACRP